MSDAKGSNDGAENAQAATGSVRRMSARQRNVIGVALAAGVVSIVLVVTGTPDIHEAAIAAWDALRGAPAPVYFGFMAVALVAPVPVIVLYVTAGPIYGVATSLAWIAPALALNALLVHALATTTLRPALARLVARRGLTLPSLERRSEQLLFATLIRVTPGIPYFVQSWTIVLAGIERTPFVLISVAIQMVYATGFVVFSQSAFEERYGLATLAIGFLVAAGLAARLVHARLRNRGAATEPRDQT